MSLRKLFSVSTSLLLVVVLFTGSAAAVGEWTPFGAQDQCSEPASVDGNYIAVSDAWDEKLYYYDIAASQLTTTSISATNPSIKGELIAYFGTGYGQPQNISLYDISKDKIISTQVTTAKGPANMSNMSGGRYFSGEHIAYVDDVDDHLKVYEVQGKHIMDTGVTMAYGIGNGPTIDGNIVAYEGDDGQVAFYDIVNETTTTIETGISPVVSGNIISYTDRRRGNLKYYEIDTAQITDTGLSDMHAQSNDGSRIVANVYGESIVVYDVATGQVQDTGLHGCSNSDTCWIDIDGDIIIHERYEGGTDAKDEAGAWYEVYPEYDYSGDGVTNDCVGGYADLSL